MPRHLPKVPQPIKYDVVRSHGGAGNYEVIKTYTDSARAERHADRLQAQHPARLYYTLSRGPSK